MRSGEGEDGFGENKILWHRLSQELCFLETEVKNLVGALVYRIAKDSSNVSNWKGVFMEQEDIFLIEVLKAFIHEKKLSDIPALSMKKLYETAVKHNVAGIIFYMLRHLMEDQKDSDIYQALKKQYIITIYNSAVKEREVEIFAEKLEQTHIPYAFFKGEELRKLYPVSELRTMGDVDILIREENMNLAGNILRRLGYEKCESGSNVWTFHKGIMFYEIHNRLAAKSYWNNIDYEAYFNGIYDKLISGENESRKYFSPEDHFIFLCFHLAKHLDSSGAGIRMFMDIAVYLMKYEKELDWLYIWKECAGIKLDCFVKNVLSICSEWFQVDTIYKTKEVDPATMKQLKEYVMCGGTFGFERDESLRRLRRGMKNADSKNSTVIKIRALWKIIFPDKKHMEDFMPAIRYYPILLPIAWCRRWRLGVENRWKMKAAVHRMGKNVDEAKEQYALLKRIGL